MTLDPCYPYGHHDDHHTTSHILGANLDRDPGALDANLRNSVDFIHLDTIEPAKG